MPLVLGDQEMSAALTVACLLAGSTPQASEQHASIKVVPHCYSFSMKTVLQVGSLAGQALTLSFHSAACGRRPDTVLSSVPGGDMQVSCDASPCFTTRVMALVCPV